MYVPALRKISQEEYLHLEELSSFKNEYVDGFVFPMHDEGHTEPFEEFTSKHSLICGNLYAALREPARAAALKLYPGQMTVRSVGEFWGRPAQHDDVPDLVATREDAPPTATFLSAPCLIVEVLSPKTRDPDRREKLPRYLSLASVQDTVLVDNTVLVDSAAPSARLFVRRSEGWREQYAEGEGVLTLSSVDVSLTLTAIYAGIQL